MADIPTIEDTSLQKPVVMEPFVVSASRIQVPKVEAPPVTPIAGPAPALLKTDTDQTIMKFYQTATSRGFARDYQARIDSIVINNKAFDTNGMVYISEFALPGVKKAVATVRYKGVEFHSPSTRNYGNSKSWEVTLYLDRKLAFRDWLIDSLTSTAANTPAAQNEKKNQNRIPNDTDYAEISIYDDALVRIKKYRIKGLFVVDVPNQGYDVSGAGKIQELKVVFGYQTWEDESDNSYTQPKLAKDYPGGKPGVNNVPNPREPFNFNLFTLFK